MKHINIVEITSTFLSLSLQLSSNLKYAALTLTLMNLKKVSNYLQIKSLKRNLSYRCTLVDRTKSHSLTTITCGYIRL